jgi:cytochrome c2
VSICAGGLLACTPSPESALGFRLPDGDAAAGRAAFVDLQCHACHEIDGIELPTPAQSGPLRIELGGEVSKVKTYGELVTSVINPSHKLAWDYPPEQVARGGESLMRVDNEVMTVQQLIDLVAFLQSHYEVVIPEYEYYGGP